MFEWRTRQHRSAHRGEASGVLLAVALLVVPLASEAQRPATVPRIGILNPVPMRPTNFDAFRQGLRELGYTEGRNISIESRSAEGRHDRLLVLARELVGLKVDVIVTSTTPAIQAARQATGTVPIVTISADPVGTGIVASLARPGGNVTGLSVVGPAMSAKQLEFAKEMLPPLKRVAFVWDPANAALALRLKEVEAAARTVGLDIESLEVRSEDELRRMLEGASGKRVGAMIVPPPIALAYGRQIIDFAARTRLPTMYESREFVEAGGLISYGASISDLWRRAATYVDKILKGAKPSDLPVEQPTKFELVVNLRTARALALTLPHSLLVRADQVLE